MNGEGEDSRVASLAGTGPGDVSGTAPAGSLEVVITYLQMESPPPPRGRSARNERVALIRAEQPTVSFYRYLYETVGGPWLWYERRLLEDEALLAIIGDPQVEIYVLYLAGVPAGFVELDRRVAGEVEVGYFGLVPEFIGRGLGAWFLDWAVERAWSDAPERVWVNTCTLDHPAALGVYQRAGFSPYHRERRLIADPRLPGAMPRGREF